MLIKTISSIIAASSVVILTLLFIKLKLYLLYVGEYHQYHLWDQ